MYSVQGTSGEICEEPREEFLYSAQLGPRGDSASGEPDKERGESAAGGRGCEPDAACAGGSALGHRLLLRQGDRKNQYL